LAAFDFGGHPELLASFPFPHTVEVSITLARRTLTIRTVVAATGDADVPLCFGFHPYLQLPGVPRQEWTIETPALRHLGVDGRGLPTGSHSAQAAGRQVLGDNAFDDGYDEVADGAVFAVSGGDRRIEVRFAKGYPAAQIFAPAGEELICFEPMAAPTDALTRGGYRTARPGNPAVAQFSITVSSAPGPGLPDHQCRAFCRRGDVAALVRTQFLDLFGDFHQPGLQRLDLIRQLDDPFDTSEIDAFILRKPLDLTQQVHIVLRVPAPAP
jgi:Aldose 1-epimerase